MAEQRIFEVYKGLQKPLVFKTYKGKFIYWMAGGLFLSFIVCVICCVAFSYAIGGIMLVGGACATTFFVNTKQKEGVHSKNRKKGVLFIKPNYKHKIKK